MDKARRFGRCDGGSIPSRGACGARSSTVEHLPLKEVVGGSNPPALTKKEIEELVGAALAAPPSADSAAKAKFKFAESR